MILHIGAGKTGTSALQVAFAQNAGKLREHGILYPENKYVDIARNGLATSGNALPLAAFLCPDLKIDIDERQAVHDLLENHANHQISTILYSSEKLSAFVPDRLRLFKKLCASLDYDLKLVFYVRSVVDHAFAMYVQRVRSLCTETFSTYLECEWGFTFASVIDAMFDVLGPSPVVLKNYDSVKSDLISDFARTVIGLDEPKIAELSRPGVINRSYSREEVQVLAEFNRFLAGPQESLRLSRHFLALTPVSSGPLTLWRNEIDIVTRKSEEGRQRVISAMGEDLAYVSDAVDVRSGEQLPLNSRTRSVLTGLFALERMRLESAAK